MKTPFFFTSKRNPLLLTIAILMLCISIFLFGRCFLAEANAKYASESLYQIAVLKALGHTHENNPYGISSGGYGYKRCNYWQGELCSGIVANRALLESQQDLKLVINALEEPCKYLWHKADKSGGDQVAAITDREIADARKFAPCKTGKLEGGKPIYPEIVDRLFIYFYDGQLREYRFDDVRLVLEIKPIKLIGDKK